MCFLTVVYTLWGTLGVPYDTCYGYMLAFLSAITKCGGFKSIPGTGARNACWHFLAQSPSVEVLSQSSAMAPEMPAGIS